MKSDIRVCGDWESAHERPVYTLGERCPDCGATAVNSAPAPYNPEDPYGEYRRRAKRRAREQNTDADTGAE
ncbi:MAG: RNA-protein complex protein Nop10 [Haloarculaceae archaeon]